ncbi:MAG: hypothetical protein IKQ77_10405 [Prevotella sp.]|nr:hypothetical protein [Prevotella sp.]
MEKPRKTMCQSTQCARCRDGILPVSPEGCQTHQMTAEKLSTSTDSVTGVVTGDVTEDVTEDVTDGVTGVVTGVVTFYDTSKPVSTSCDSVRCECGSFEGVTLNVTLDVTFVVTSFVTANVTSKKEKNKRKKIFPLHPLKKKKNKKRKKLPHKRACMREKSRQENSKSEVCSHTGVWEFSYVYGACSFTPRLTVFCHSNDSMLLNRSTELRSLGVSYTYGAFSFALRLRRQSFSPKRVDGYHILTEA